MLTKISGTLNGNGSSKHPSPALGFSKAVLIFPYHLCLWLLISYKDSVLRWKTMLSFQTMLPASPLSLITEIQIIVLTTYHYFCVCMLSHFSHIRLCDPMDCNPPGFSVHGNSPGKNTGVGCHALLQGIFPTKGSNWGLLHCRQILHQLSY